jgi:Protein of unknown function (DUF3987)
MPDKDNKLVEQIGFEAIDELQRDAKVIDLNVSESAETIFDANLGPPKPFPVDAFPAPVSQFITEVAEALPCPPDFIGVAFLALAGAAIGTSREIVIKSSWREGPRIYAAIVADPGSRKSPALRLAAQPIYDFQDEEWEKYRHAKELYELELKKLEAKKKANSTYEPANDSRLIEPELTQLYSTDSTLEALATVLRINPRGISYIQDELSAWVLSQNQYKARGTDRQAWLSFWSGTPIIINRKSNKETLEIKEPLVNVIGCIQPDIVDQLNDEKGREDGFIHRILFAIPEKTELYWTEKDVSDSTKAGYASVFKSLFEMEPLKDDHGRNVPKRIIFTAHGKTVFVNWLEKRHFKERNNPSLPEILSGPWAKFDGYAARIALIIHLTRLVSGEVKSERIDEKSVRAAIKLIDYFKDHCAHVYTEIRTRAEKLKCDSRIIETKKIVDWIKGKGGSASSRDLSRYKVGGIKNAEEAKELMKEIEKQGLGKIKKVKKSGRTSYLLELSS